MTKTCIQGICIATHWGGLKRCSNLSFTDESIKREFSDFQIFLFDRLNGCSENKKPTATVKLSKL
ncbi:hypothetical protein EK904_008957, partial [Melospiza melodia maxima]